MNRILQCFVTVTLLSSSCHLSLSSLTLVKNSTIFALTTSLCSRGSQWPHSSTSSHIRMSLKYCGISVSTSHLSEKAKTVLAQRRIACVLRAKYGSIWVAH